MSGKSLAMMPWFPRDFIAATRHLALAERGAYRELLDYQWEMGGLPKDPVRLARLLVVTPEEFAPIWAAISDKFEESPSGLVNKRLEEHRKKAIDQLNKKIDGANKTNAKRHAERGAERVGERGAERVDIGSPPSPSPSPSDKDSVVVRALGEMSAAGEMATALRKLDVGVTSMHPTLLAWIKDGFTAQQVCEAVDLARKNPGKESGQLAANYLDRILRQPTARPPPLTAQRGKGAWDRMMEANGD
jgi:uncharacterized protein YdaU (DUF1376 family)